MANFEQRLNQILDRLTSADLLQGAGLGNEIAFYIFDYPPENELEVRNHINILLNLLPKKKPDLKFTHINLFKLLIDYLQERTLLDKVIKFQRDGGDAGTLKALKGPLDAAKIAKFFVAQAKPQENDLVLVSGVGNAYPILRTHHLLNNLHHLMGNTPLVMFYPGGYSGQGLRLFNLLEEENYYRAFRLIP